MSFSLCVGRLHVRIHAKCEKVVPIQPKRVPPYVPPSLCHARARATLDCETLQNKAQAGATTRLHAKQPKDPLLCRTRFKRACAHNDGLSDIINR